MTLVFDQRLARQALADLPELAAQEDLSPPALARVYVPAQHAKALHLDASVVVGMRGAGKSWWTAVLASDTTRNFVSPWLHGSSLDRVTARVGFGLDETERDFPRPETLGALLDSGVEPMDIWQTVLLKHALNAVGHSEALVERPWRAAVDWLVGHRDEANASLTTCDAALEDDGRVLLVLFDAFDRLAADWQKVRRLTTGALKLGLRLRSRRAIRAKFFIRPDLEEDDEVWGFADSSKLRHAKVDLTWGSADLYGLVFMHLGNSQAFGPQFRKTSGEACEAGWNETTGVWVPPRQILSPEAQEQIIEAVADDTMGTDPKRGFTFSWVPLHLADAKGRISPRSYLLAFKKAAEETSERWPEHGRALHYKAVQQGIVKASEVRVAEISEDYPWVTPLLEAARDGVVPMTIDDVSERWSAGCLRQMKKAVGTKLPPRRFTNDPFRKGTPEALIDDLVELAVFYRTKDGRLNMPDIFRVAFGIRRKGGVRPPR